MARRRMISNAICSDKRVDNLSDDTSRLAFTWLITFADCEGRTYGDPALIRSMLFPRRQDVTIERMERYVQEWAACRLIIWYEAEDDLWIQFPGFVKNQPGLRKDREPESFIPAPQNGRLVIPFVDESTQESITVQDVIQQSAGSLPDECPVILKENILKEKKACAPPAAVIQPDNYVAIGMRAYENIIGLVTGQRQAEEISAILAELHENGWDSWWQISLDIASGNESRSWPYVRSILESHLRDGTPPKPKNGSKPPQAVPRKQAVKVRDPLTGEISTREAMI
jgi:hypothetical protein